MIFLEDSSTVTALTPPNLPLSGKGYVYLPLIRGIKGVIGLDTTFASTNSDYSKRTPLTKGDTLGILLGNTGATLNQPVQETGTGVDVVLTSTGYVVYFTKDTTATGTGISLITAFTTNSPDGKSISKYDPNLVGYWDMETLTETLLKDLSGKGNDGVCYNSGIAVNCGTTGQ